MRLHLVDGIRGHLLIGMLIAHLSFEPGFEWLGYFHHQNILQMYDAEFFIPISGFIIGFLFESKMKSMDRFYTFLLARIKVVYPYYIISAVPFMLLALMNESTSDALSAIGSVFIMQNGGHYSDILPIYIYCFMILAATFWIVPKIGLRGLVAISAMIYLASQTTYTPGMFGLSSAFVVFDVAAWQFLFILFLVIGIRHREIVDLVCRLSTPAYFGVMGALAVLFAITLTAHLYPTPFDGWQHLAANWPRLQLHPYFLLKILVVSALICATLVRPQGVLSAPSKALRWYFQLPFLKNVGRFSIQMFTLHVFIMALFRFSASRATQMERSGLALLMIALFIALPNIWVAVLQRRRLATAT